MTAVTLTTDFGTVDGYVGAMKGMILTRAPDAVIVDITHDVPRHDVAAAAFALAQAAPTFPAGTIHVVVVDPGVGGPRRAVVVEDGRHVFVGPDNGVFALVAPEPCAAYEIASPAFRAGEVSATFHGRDVFAPAAARLAAGAEAAEAGPAVALTGKLPGGAAKIRPDGGGRLVAGVIHVDRFGNLITALPAADVAAGATIRVGGQVISGLEHSYASVGRGQLVAYIGSAGTLEIAIREGSAAEALAVERGAEVEVEAGGVGPEPAARR